MVYGESIANNKHNMQCRTYRLGREKVPDKTTYDHVWIKAFNGLTYISRTNEKISKSRRALSAASSLGIKTGGLSMHACNIIYWCLIVPIQTYGSELWVLKQVDIEALDKFQRYAGKRIQRFPKWTPNETSFRGLGWMRLETYTYAKKLFFIRTIMIRDDDCIYKGVFRSRAIQFNSDIERYSRNECVSPIFDMLRISIIFDIYHIVKRNVYENDHMYSKSQWKSIIWTRAWQIEGLQLAIWHYIL